MPPQDIFSSYGGFALTPPGSVQPTSAQTTAPRTAQATQPDIFQAYGGHALTDSANPKPTGDPFQAYGGYSLAKSSPVPKDEDRFGEGESWYSRPLTSSILGIPEYRQGAGGIERGVEKFASGLSSPVSLGLMLATGGLGSLAEGAGAEALEGLAPEVAAQVSRAAGTVSKLAHTGFTLQQIGSAASTLPRAADAIRTGDYDQAKELLTTGLLSGAVAGLSAKGLADRLGGKEFTWTGDKDAIGAYQHQAETHNVIARQFERANAPLIKNRPLDMAARLYHEAGGDPSKLEQWRNEVAADNNIRPAVRQKFANLLRMAQVLPEDVKAVSDKLRSDYARDWDTLKAIGKIDPEKAGRENYAGQHIYNPNDEDASNLRAKARMTKSPGFTKQRSFDTLVDALHKGFEPKDIGLAAARADYIRQFGQMRGAMDAEHTLLSKTAEDNRPIGVNPASVQNVAGKRVIRIPDTDLSQFDPDRIITKNGKNYLNVSDYREGPDVFARYRVTQQLFDEEGNPQPVFQRQNVLVHPDFQDAVERAFGNQASWIRNAPILGGLLKASTSAKRTLLSFSPFHYSTEFLRGLQLGMSPLEILKPEELTPDRPAVKIGTRYGLQLLGDRSARSLAAEGSAMNTDLINRVPYFGRAVGAVEDHLFGNWLPRLKAAAFEKLADQLAEKNPNWNEAQVYASAAKITNGGFGGINWRMLGASMTGVDALRLMFLAPDFTGSQLLFAKSGLEPGGSVVWQSMGRIALYNFAVARALNLLLNGELHPEHPFGIVSPDGKRVYSIRTMPSDIWHGLSDPRGFGYNRLNPLLLRTGWELATGRDNQGRIATSQKQITDLIRNVTPISFQNFIPNFRREGEGIGAGIARGLGVGSEPNITEAEKLANQLASYRSKRGPVDPDKLGKYQRMQQAEDDLRAGRSTDLSPFSMTERKQVIQTAHKYRDQEFGNLQAKFSRLDMNGALQVFTVATPHERSILAPELLRRKQSYLKTLAKMSPAERAAEESSPTYQTLVRMGLAPALRPLPKPTDIFAKYGGVALQ